MQSSSLTRGQTRAPCTWRAVSAVDPQRSPEWQHSHPGCPRDSHCLICGIFSLWFSPPLLTAPWWVTSASAWRTPQVPHALPPGSFLPWSPPQPELSTVSVAPLASPVTSPPSTSCSFTTTSHFPSTVILSFSCQLLCMVNWTYNLLTQLLFCYTHDTFLYRTC